MQLNESSRLADFDLELLAKLVAAVESGNNPNSLAMRSNNPGNLAFAGQQGASQGENLHGMNFAQFDTPEAGMNALINQLGMYASGQSAYTDSNATLQDVMNVYAPSGHGNNNPAAYVQSLLQGYNKASPVIQQDATQPYNPGRGQNPRLLGAPSNHSPSLDFNPTGLADLFDSIDSTPQQPDQGVFNVAERGSTGIVEPETVGSFRGAPKDIFGNSLPQPSTGLDQQIEFLLAGSNPSSGASNEASKKATTTTPNIREGGPIGPEDPNKSVDKTADASGASKDDNLFPLMMLMMMLGNQGGSQRPIWM